MEFTKKFTKTFHVQKTWARMGTLTRLYAEMAEAAYVSFLCEQHGRIPEEPDDDYSEERRLQDNRMTKLGIESIVFTAMTLESAIYELAAINLGDEMASTHLDKLDLKAKWAIVPQLICGESLCESGPGLNGLTSLVKARNRLVHHKSMPWSDNIEQAIEKMELNSKRFMQDVNSSYKVLILISLELENLIGTTGPLPWFNHAPTYTPNQHKNPLLAKIISSCKVTHQKVRNVRGT